MAQNPHDRREAQFGFGPGVAVTTLPSSSNKPSSTSSVLGVLTTITTGNGFGMPTTITTNVPNSGMVFTTKTGVNTVWNLPYAFTSEVAASGYYLSTFTSVFDGLPVTMTSAIPSSIVSVQPSSASSTLAVSSDTASSAAPVAASQASSASQQQPDTANSSGNNNSTLLPAVIVPVVVVVLAIAGLIFFFLRRRRTRQRQAFVQHNRGADGPREMAETGFSRPSAGPAVGPMSTTAAVAGAGAGAGAAAGRSRSNTTRQHPLENIRNNPAAVTTTASGGTAVHETPQSSYGSTSAMTPGSVGSDPFGDHHNSGYISSAAPSIALGGSSGQATHKNYSSYPTTASGPTSRPATRDDAISIASDLDVDSLEEEAQVSTAQRASVIQIGGSNPSLSKT